MFIGSQMGSALRYTHNKPQAEFSAWNPKSAPVIWALAGRGCKTRLGEMLSQYGTGGAALRSDTRVSLWSAEMGFPCAMPKPLVLPRFVRRCLTLSCNRDDELELCVIAVKLSLYFYQSITEYQCELEDLCSIASIRISQSCFRL